MAFSFHRYKEMKLLIGNPDNPHGKANGTVHLYNLTSDPNEMNDISKEYPETVGSLKNRLFQYVKNMIAPDIADEILAGNPHLNGGVFGPGWCKSRPEEDATTTTGLHMSCTGSSGTCLMLTCIAFINSCNFEFYSILVGAQLNTTTPPYITSPNYPYIYPNHVDCELTITGPSGNYIKLNFVSFKLGLLSSSKCK